MTVVQVYDKNGEKKETLELNDDIFGSEIKNDIMHEVVSAYLTNQRQGTKATKGRSQVNRTGAKMYRQKGTGRARGGNASSPIRKGGAHAFSLEPKEYRVRISKAKKRAALKSALSSRLKSEQLVVVEDFVLDNYKTKEMEKIFCNLNIYGSALFILPENDDVIYKSSRNIPGTEVMKASDINTYQVLKNDYTVIMRSAISKLEENLK